MEEKRNITSAFPEYTGPCEIESCIDYIQEKFKGQNMIYQREIVFHNTTAIDRDKLIKIWDQVSTIVLNEALKETGIGI